MKKCTHKGQILLHVIMRVHKMLILYFLKNTCTKWFPKAVKLNKICYMLVLKLDVQQLSPHSSKLWKCSAYMKEQ